MSSRFADIRELRGITFDDKLGLRIGALAKHAELARFGACAQALSDAGRHGVAGRQSAGAQPGHDRRQSLLRRSRHRPARLPDGARRRGRAAAARKGSVCSRSRISPGLLRHRAGGGRAGGRDPRAAVLVQRRLSRALPAHGGRAPAAGQRRGGGRKNGDVCEEVRLVVGASTAKPTRLRKAEEYPERQIRHRAVAAEAADIGASEIEPISDIRGDGEFRRDMVRVVARRTIAELFGLPKAPKRTSHEEENHRSRGQRQGRTGRRSRRAACCPISCATTCT